MSTSKHFGYLLKPLFPGARGGEDYAAERRRLRRRKAQAARANSGYKGPPARPSTGGCA